MYFVIRPAEKNKETYLKMDKEDVWIVDDKNGNLSTVSIDPGSTRQAKPLHEPEGFIITEDKDSFTIEPVTTVTPA